LVVYQGRVLHAIQKNIANSNFDYYGSRSIQVAEMFALNALVRTETAKIIAKLSGIPSTCLMNYVQGEFKKLANGLRYPSLFFFCFASFLVCVSSGSFDLSPPPLHNFHNFTHIHIELIPLYAPVIFL